MKRVNRHPEPKEALPKTRKKRASAPLEKTAKKKLLKNGEAPKYTAPIFNTRYAGKPLKYIRPFDPVWPSEEPQK